MHILYNNIKILQETIQQKFCQAYGFLGNLEKLNNTLLIKFNYKDFLKEENYINFILNNKPLDLGIKNENKIIIFNKIKNKTENYNYIPIKKNSYNKL